MGRIRYDMEVEAMDQISDEAAVRRSIKGVLNECLPQLRIRIAVKKAKGVA
jgi:hypothetical protein